MSRSKGSVVHRFLSEEDCNAYLFSIKWPDGFCCPRCGHTRAYTVNTRRLPLYQCHACRHQTSLTVGTVMEGSRTPLRKWVVALQLLSQPSSVNAVQLSEQVGVTYKTAWSMLRKIRQAIRKIDSNQLLSGTVRAGLTFYGRTYHQPFVRHPKEHPVLVGAAFDSNGEPFYVKLMLVSAEHMNEKSILRSGEEVFVEQHVQARTDNIKMLKRFQLHEVRLLPQVFSQAKAWINRTFHGIGAKYLQAYLDEFCFRFNQSYRDTSIIDVLSGICMASQSKLGCLG